MVENSGSTKAGTGENAMITKEKWGVCERGSVDAYTLDNGKGLKLTVLTLGGTIQKLEAFGVDVTLGYDTLEEYVNNSGYFGALIGRVANRIAGAVITLDGVSYLLTKNRAEHMIHGGAVGFDKKIWDAFPEEEKLVLRLRSEDGEEGFPGTTEVTVTYSLDENNGVRIDYLAIPDKKTAINMTNHAYFNLNGGGSVLGHKAWVDADRYTETDELGIPSGNLPNVEGTFLDFRTEKNLVSGIDHNFCLNGSGMRRVARIRGKRIAMEVETTTPGVQIYCAGLKVPRTGKNGVQYIGNCFVCLECQGYPDAIHHENFPSILVDAGEEYRQTTIYRFSKC